MTDVEYLPEKPRTVCKECKWGMSVRLGSIDPWCEALGWSASLGWDVVYGKEHFDHSRCFEVNNGECPHYEPEDTP